MLKIDPLEPLMISKLHQLGCNISWIARLMVCGRDRVYRQLRKQINLPATGKTGRPREKIVSKKRQKEIIDLEAAGISPVDIAQVMEIGLPVVLKVVYEKKEIKRNCLRCEALTPDWICKKCKRKMAKTGPDIYKSYT